MKQYRHVLLAVLALACTGHLGYAQFTYTIHRSEVTITGYTGSGGDVVIPDTIEELPVIAIGNDAFRRQSTLISVTIPDSVTSIGVYGFRDCPSLNSVTIGNSVTNIGISAFSGCTSLASATIPDSVSSIGYDAFGDCTSLAAINVDPLNPNYGSLDGVLFNKNQTRLIQCPGGKIGEYSVPEGVTNILEYAFYGCTSLTSVTIPDRVTSIERRTFIDCIRLARVVIGRSVTRIGDFAFSRCRNITNVTFSDSVITIEEYAFQDCFNLASVTFPESLSRIEDYAFSGCRMTSVTIPASVAYIGSAAFDRLSRTGGVYFRGNAPRIGFYCDYYECVPTFGNAPLHYLPGTTGWSASSIAGSPTQLWVRPDPVILDFGPSFGVLSNGFGFTISWATNADVIVEASTDPASSTWSPVSTNTLVEGTSYFSDPDWTDHPARLYRLRSPR